MTEPRRGHYDRSLVMWITERERQTDRQTDKQSSYFVSAWPLATSDPCPSWWGHILCHGDS